jgi:DNA topoisomerase I
MKLVIVESPTKARTIGRFLGKDFVIKASMGHVMDLPKQRLSVDVDHDFDPLYEIDKKKSRVISDLKSSAKKADTIIILATDPDREGEAIASHVAEMLSSSSKFNPPAGGQNSKLKRIVFHEITKDAIDEALKNPREIDKNLVDAQTARRVLDRLVGYKLSPLLWKKVRRGLSAGRVQSVALRLIVEREREIEKFGKEKYYAIHVILNSAQDPKQDDKEIPKPSNSAGRQVRDDRGEPRPFFPTEFELIEINGNKIEIQKSFDLYDGKYKITKTTIDSEKKAKGIVDDLKVSQFRVSDVLKKEMKRSPSPPFTTSTLQQQAAQRLGLNGRRTMSIAQKLYEEGFITYHRTDSVNMSGSAVNSIRNFVKKEFGDKYIPEKPRFYKTRQKAAQEAHESIRPTAVGQLLIIKDKLLNTIGNQGWKMYEMIWKRAVASQMSDAIIESTSVLVDSQAQSSKFKVQNEGSIYKFKANGSVLVFDGFLKINPFSLEDKRLPKFSTNQSLNVVDVFEKAHETMPPPRYNDASIIKSLEEEGIGRPSTYATIISTIETRTYIERQEGRFLPTPVGAAVNDFLVKNFSDIDDIPFTSSMEDSLDEIADGRKKWVPVIKDFYKPFEKKLAEVEGAERVKIKAEETDENCPTCGYVLVIRTGKFGKFISCSTFPKCKFTKPFVESTGHNCPKCKKGLVIIKKTRKGRKFYGCSNYPACTFAAWNLKDLKK